MENGGSQAGQSRDGEGGAGSRIISLRWNFHETRRYAGTEGEFVRWCLDEGAAVSAAGRVVDGSSPLDWVRGIGPHFAKTPASEPSTEVPK